MQSCRGVFEAFTWTFSLAVSTTSILFLFRIRAVFWNDRWVIGTFLLLWLVVTGVCLVVPFSGGARHIGPTDACVETAKESVFVGCFISVAAYDTLVFCVISWRLVVFSGPEEGLRSKLRYFWGTGMLPLISETLLRSGQQYYL